MADLALSLACWDYDRTRPLFDGRVKPEGIGLATTVMRPQEAFRQLLDDTPFQVGEMSFSTYLAMQDHRDSPLVAIPVMLSKMFRHDCIYVRRDAALRSPRDLIGKRVGTMRYSSTGLIYVKGLLQHDFGVAPNAMRWVLGGLETPVMTVRPREAPGDVAIEHAGGGDCLVSLLAKGELDALISLYLPSSFMRGEEHIHRMFPDFRTVEIDYYRRTKIFPIMHVLAIRRDLYEQEPWIAKSLYDAFVAAKSLAQHAIYDTDALHVSLPFLIDDVEQARRLFGPDYYAYGLEANRTSVEALCQYAHEQGLTARLVEAEELFVPVRSARS